MDVYTRKSFRDARKSTHEKSRPGATCPRSQNHASPSTMRHCRILSKVGQHLAACYHYGPSKLEVDYHMLDDVVGSGCTGDVHLAQRRNDPDNMFAIKTYEVDKLTPEDRDFIKMEVEILTQVSHPHILQASDVYEDEAALRIVSPYMPGGHLATPNSLSELQVVIAAQQMVAAVQHLHAVGYVHRDIKPLNVLLDSHDDVKLIDFGLSAHWKQGDRPLLLECGTPGYMSPEMRRRAGYTNKTDLWSLGVCIFFLLNGELPFGDEYTCFPSQQEVDARIESCTRLGSRAKHFLRSLMKVDPSRRPSAEEASVHPWIAADARVVNSPLALEEWEQMLLDSQTKKSSSRWADMIDDDESNDEVSALGPWMTREVFRCAGISGERKVSVRPKAARWVDILSDDEE